MEFFLLFSRVCRERCIIFMVYLQPLCLGILFGKLKVRWCWRFDNRHKRLTLIDYLLRIFKCFWNIGKNSCHLFRRLEIELMHGVAHTVWIIVEFIHPDTHKSLMILCIVWIGIVRIVCCYHFYACLTRYFKYLLIYKELIADTVTHKLKIKILAKYLLVLTSHL